jgi:Tol biopolymer transport system component
MWSGDGERIVFQSEREGDRGLFWQRADGVGTAERLTKAETAAAQHVSNSWSPKAPLFSFMMVLCKYPNSIGVRGFRCHAAAG